MRNVLEDKTLLRGALLKTPYALHKATYGQFPSTSPTVCALRFTSRTRDTYELKTFKTTLDAQNEGYQITHTGACGACSSLKDLHTYLTKPNLTTPVRSCASQWFGTRESLKQCLVKEVGFTSWCADAWAHNVRHTRDKCFGVCVAEYGWWNLLLGRFPKSNNTASGALRPCVRCDEEQSGPGFKYAAGRTRRNSGILSGIKRKNEEVSQLRHDQYFEAPKLPISQD